MFVILLIASTFLCQGLTIVSYGRNFITAFPENLGYFYPFNSSRIIRVTTLADNTSFTVFYNNTNITKSYVQRGLTTTFTFPKTAEIYQLNYSTNSIRIVSAQNIVVHSMSRIDNNLEQSGHTNLVQATANLGTHYLIPSLNHTGFITTFSGSTEPSVPKRYSSFKLIIINAEDTENSITIVRNISDSLQEETFKIPSYQLIQLEANASLRMVKSSHKVAVLLTHPCLEKSDCKCSLIINQILPQQFQGQNFVVPSIPGITQSWLLMTSNDATSSLSQNNVPLQPSPSGLMSHLNQTQFQYITASGKVSLRLISPGLFIELIPENMFAACYMLQFYVFLGRRALVIAETDSRNDVRTQYEPMKYSVWTAITGTKYSSTTVFLVRQSTYIWHPSSKIAVYILDTNGTMVYASPAIPISDNPDEFGCVANPGEFIIGNEPLSWTESLAYCTSIQKQFACPTSEDKQMTLANNVKTTEDKEGWIGLRRSLMTTDWYWQRQLTSLSLFLNYTYWADGQPLDSFNGLCASLSLVSQDGFKWKTAKCCEKKLPVCYIPQSYPSPLYQGGTDNIPFVAI